MLRGVLCCSLFSVALLGQGARTPKVSPPAGDGQISGIVVDAGTNQPVSGARVAISPVSKRDDLTTTLTAADGRFTFPGLAPGKYTLLAQHRGYLTQNLNQHGQYATSITVGRGLDSSNLLFRMTPEGTISGVVTDEAGESVRESQVMLFQVSIDEGTRATGQRTAATTDDEGRYRFSHLPAGKYFVAVSAWPWYAQYPQVWVRGKDDVTVEDPPAQLEVAYPLTFYGGATDSSSAQPIQLGEGEKIAADINLHPVPAAHFRVEADDSGSPNFHGGSNVMMEQTVFDGLRIQIPTRTTFGGGVREVVGLPPGHFTAKVQSFGNGSTQTLQEQEVTVGDGAVLETSPASPAIPLTATLRYDPPAPGPLQVSLQLRGINSNVAFNERTGDKSEVEFKQGLAPGAYEVSVQSGQDVFIRSIQSNGATITGRILQIKGPAPVKLSILLGQGMGEVSGVAERDGKTVPGAMIVLVPADPANNRVLFRRDQSDSDGTFRLASVVPGQYTLLAIEDGWDLEWANPAVLQKFMPAGQALTVETRGKPSVRVKVQSSHQAVAQE